MRFSEISRRVTGFSTPIFGVSWEPGEAEVTAARRVITFLEDRRVLFEPTELEQPEHCVMSVIEIRRFLTELLGSLGDDEDLAPHLVAMRAACRRFVTVAQGLEDRGSELMKPWMNGTPAWTFNSALGELRGVVGVHVAQIATKFGLDVEDDLAQTLPESPDTEDDDNDDDRRFWRLR
ncbi:MAG: hypothetical protein GY701_16560 [Sulfitobacter sp.]|nr:hypothetical protein [Sulfitobacter sp.]